MTAPAADPETGRTLPLESLTGLADLFVEVDERLAAEDAAVATKTG